MGTVKKCQLTDFGNTRKGGLNAISLLENEELISVKLTDGNSNIIMATKLGLSIHFSEQDVRVMGRTARGVRGLALKKNDSVVAMDVVRDDSYILTITEEGLGKRTLISEYRAQTRGGKGIINIKINERTGVVAGVRIVREDDELIVISSEGIVIRTDVNAISIVGRSAQGVKVMRLDDGDKVVALATVNKKIIEE